MRAVVQHEFGGPEVLTVSDVPTPEPGPTEIRVRAGAVGVNPVDYWSRIGEGYVDVLPFVPGWDIAGTVDVVGEGVTLFEPGDRVMGMPWFPAEGGCYAEYVVGPARHFVHTPISLSDVEAAALPLAGLTAWQALVDAAAVRSGQRVIITAAGGGVGHLAVQIATALGAAVIASARSDKHPLLRALGATEVLDYREVDIGSSVRDVDVVLDPYGGATSVRLIRTLRPGGVIIPLLGGATDDVTRAATAHGVRARSFLVEPDRMGLLELSQLAEAGALRPHVAATWPLSEAAMAHRHLELGRTAGKLVLTIE